MNIYQINEAIDFYTEGNYKYANVDAKQIYDNCINKDYGSHSFEEADQFKEFVGIDKNTTEDELRALRNTLVRYWADNSKQDNSNIVKMGDQMQFFTTVIDMMIDDLKHREETITEESDMEINQKDLPQTVVDAITGLVDFDEEGNPYIYYQDFQEFVDCLQEENPDLLNEIEIAFKDAFDKLNDGKINTLTIVNKDINESLKGYKTIAKIIQNDKGYNVAENDEPMLVKDQTSLKGLLNSLAQYL